MFAKVFKASCRQWVVWSHVYRLQLQLLSEVVLSPCVAGSLHSKVRHSHLRATPINLVDIINLFSEGGLGDASNALHKCFCSIISYGLWSDWTVCTLVEISVGQRLLLLALTPDSSVRKGYLLTILGGNCF